MLFRPADRFQFLAFLAICVPALLFTFSNSAHATSPEDTPKPPVDDQSQDVTGIDLEELMKVQVTTPGKKEESMVNVPAAIYVIRSEDIKRNGITILPEALRQAPGIFVGRQSMNNWIISARGFNSGSANKLLVLMDGRSVYSPLHSGVFWDAQDTMLEDIDRIEVIRGPGGSLWGANAVNGVINIITKSAKDTQGVYLNAGGGIETQGIINARYGFQLSDDNYMRVYAKYLDYDNSVDAFTGDGAHDALRTNRAGFRSDYKLNDREHLTIQGDLYQGGAQLVTTQTSLTAPFSQSTLDKTQLQGANILGRWDKKIDSSSSLQAQVYLDYAYRSDDFFKEDVRTADFDIQYRFTPWQGHDIVCGLGYRIYSSDVQGSFTLSVQPEERTDDVPSAFIQDEMTVIQNQLWFTLGSKFEYNDYTGFEFQPSARLNWKIDEHNMSWASVSRAVRTPSIIDEDYRFNAAAAAGPVLLSAFGSHDFQSEELIAIESGYRTQPNDWMSFDLALFYNDYDNLRSTQFGTIGIETTPAPPHFLIPLTLVNDNRARSYGAELATNFQVKPWWLITANYSFMRLNMRPKNRSTDPTPETDEGLAPTNQVWLRSSMDLPANFSLDITSRYVDRLPEIDVNSYIEADVRIAWRDPKRGFEMSLIGQNLLHDDHREYGTATSGNAIQRGAFLLATWKF